MKKFGLGLDGCEQGIEQLLKQHINFSQSQVYTVIEIGSAGCVTLRAFKDIVSENRLGHWRVIGFDLPDGWSLDMNEINQVFDERRHANYFASLQSPFAENQRWFAA